MDIRLDGKSAVITGGSKDLGLAMAEKFASSGADVAILARNPDTLAEAQQQIQARTKGKDATVSVEVLNLWTGLTHLAPSEAYQYYCFPLAGLMLLALTIWRLKPASRSAALQGCPAAVGRPD